MTQSEKIAKYEEIVPQIEALVSGVEYGISSLANIAAVIHRNMKFFWTGFYVVDGDFLLLGPFQGDAACIRIPKGKGVCGSAWAQGSTIVVKNVEDFPGHIACSSLSKSEIVVPVFSNSGNITAVLDIDSDTLATFDDVDKKYLEGGEGDFSIISVSDNKAEVVKPPWFQEGESVIKFNHVTASWS